jgi:hypothetical protein
MRDLPQSVDLLALARELLLVELLPLLPPERERDAHLIATAMAIVASEARGGDWQGEIAAQVDGFYREAAPRPGPLSTRGAGQSGNGAALLRRFAADLRRGAFETSPSRSAMARAILWRLTIAKLRENNPHFLAANGIAESGEGSE